MKRYDLDEILARRAELVNRAAAQRRKLTRDFNAVKSASAWVERVASAVAYLRANPIVLGGAALALVVVVRRPLLRGGLLGLLRRGFVVWRTYRSLRTLALRIGR